ncbi:hypothetical protein AURDEDRAFT_171466 [Auricularia subglabra TFB-10046 SS5]|nr:hypothetical protein AURDEDRAFT_171466 [Auricularia subglabra TFB-10046 SS5]
MAFVPVATSGPDLIRTLCEDALLTVQLCMYRYADGYIVGMAVQLRRMAHAGLDWLHYPSDRGAWIFDLGCLVWLAPHLTAMQFTLAAQLSYGRQRIEVMCSAAKSALTLRRIYQYCWSRFFQLENPSHG